MSDFFMPPTNFISNTQLDSSAKQPESEVNNDNSLFLDLLSMFSSKSDNLLVESSQEDLEIADKSELLETSNYVLNNTNNLLFTEIASTKVSNNPTNIVLTESSQTENSQTENSQTESSQNDNNLESIPLVVVNNDLDSFTSKNIETNILLKPLPQINTFTPLKESIKESSILLPKENKENKETFTSQLQIPETENLALTHFSTTQSLRNLPQISKNLDPKNNFLSNIDNNLTNNTLLFETSFLSTKEKNSSFVSIIEKMNAEIENNIKEVNAENNNFYTNEDTNEINLKLKDIDTNSKLIATFVDKEKIEKPMQENKSDNLDLFSKEESNQNLLVSTTDITQTSTPKIATSNFAPMIGQISEQMILLAKNTNSGQTKSLQITLSPEDLGKVEIQLTCDEKGHLTTKILVESNKSYNILSNNLSDLRSNLEQTGILIEQLNIENGFYSTNQNSKDQKEDSPSKSYTLEDETISVNKSSETPSLKSFLSLHV